MGEEEMLNTRALLALTEALRSGALRAGQFLSMPQLVEILRVPIAAVREATRHGQVSGWLDVIPKRGVQILEAEPATIRDSLDLRMVLDQEGARRWIRGGLDAGELAALRQAHERMRETARGAGTPELSAQAIQVDLSLHDFLARGLGNPMLRADYESNRIRIAIFQRVRPFVQERVRSAMEEHLAIIAALERRDSAATTEAIAYHCERTQHWWGVSPG
ncbi:MULTISPECIES: GntR family transcriptional regulator [Paracoccus]|uniref:GntR family transcriptional regulator n=1 Tax=Paracoccus TaxID=265 RepID=UPI000786012A|nr:MULTISPECIES: GntR family transcriptional regulator [Paracoccus]MCV2447401.1 GntR family transcriptional regulator [Paracoccus sp. DMF]MDQ7777450.1 GntR family transcriptional regulator [Paracoccus aminovorans]